MAKKKKVKIGKVQSKRGKSKGKTKLSLFRIILISSFFVLIVGITFAIIQFIGETFGFLPVIQIDSLSWGQSGDPIILFIIGLLSSIFIGSIVVLLLIRNHLIV